MFCPCDPLVSSSLCFDRSLRFRFMPFLFHYFSRFFFFLTKCFLPMFSPEALEAGGEFACFSFLPFLMDSLWFISLSLQSLMTRFPNPFFSCGLYFCSVSFMFMKLFDWLTSFFFGSFMSWFTSFHVLITQLMSLRTAVARSSASEGYIMKENMQLWSHTQKNRVNHLEEGLEKLRFVFLALPFNVYLERNRMHEKISNGQEQGYWEDDREGGQWLTRQKQSQDQDITESNVRRDNKEKSRKEWEEQ